MEDRRVDTDGEAERRQGAADLYRAAIERSQTGILVLDTRGQVVIYNDAMHRMTGYTGDELTPETWATALYDTPEAQAEAQAAYQRTMAGIPTVSELPVRRKDGRVLWLAQFATEIRLGEMRYFVVYSYDVTARRNTEAEREQVVKELEAANRELESISRVSDVALSTLRLDDLLVVLLGQLVDVMHADKALFLLVDGDDFVLGATHNLTALPADFRMPLSDGISGAVAQSQHPRYFRDVLGEPARLPGFFEAEHIATAVSAPLQRGDRLVGVVHVFWTARHGYDPSELRLLDIVGDRATLAIVNAQLFEQTRQAREYSDALERINAAANSTLDFDEMMRRVVAEATQGMGCDSMTVELRQGDEWVVTYGNGSTAEAVGIRFRTEEMSVAEQALRTRRPVTVDDTATDARIDRSLTDAYHVRSMLVVPMVIRDEVAGLLFFHYERVPRSFTRAQADFGRRVAAVVALAVANSRLYGAQEKIAQTIQQALLAVPEHIESMRFGHVYRSGTEATEVGGDFYDLFPLADGRIGVLLGDVSGKGLQAATLAALVKNATKAYAYQDPEPACVLRSVNTLVWHSSPSESFVTMFFGILDRSTGELCFCSAGHPAPIICREGGPTVLNVTCPLLGALEDAVYREEAALLGPGDALILYSDGVTEARRDHDFFGEKRLVEAISKLRPVAVAETMPQLLLDEVLDFTGGRLFDDLAILVVSITRRI